MLGNFINSPDQIASHEAALQAASLVIDGFVILVSIYLALGCLFFSRVASTKNLPEDSLTVGRVGLKPDTDWPLAIMGCISMMLTTFVIGKFIKVIGIPSLSSHQPVAFLAILFTLLLGFAVSYVMADLKNRDFKIRMARIGTILVIPRLALAVFILSQLNQFQSSELIYYIEHGQLPIESLKDRSETVNRIPI